MDLPDPGIQLGSPALQVDSLSVELPGNPTIYKTYYMDFPGNSAGKESTCNEGDLGLIPGLGRSPGEEKGYPLQYSSLENSMDCTVHGLSKSQT